MDDLCFLSATELAGLVARRELKALEVVETHLSQVGRFNPSLNAIVTLVADQALEQAAAADARLAGGAEPPPLHGLPVAHKDLVLTKGIRTTFGSQIYRDFVPEEDALIVRRLRAAGAITIGKTNTPEFGAGSQTFNEVFGPTRNPYDLGKTCGGSSGGAAVALASGMVPLADGSDMGGSLRNPASFCNVVGFRTSPGRVPVYPARDAWANLSVEGPMARTVEDVALMLDVLAGPDRSAPMSLPAPTGSFAGELDRDLRGVRLAWNGDFGGLPVDSRVTAVIERQLGVFRDLGCEIEDATPDFEGADRAFKARRAFSFRFLLSSLDESQQQLLKPTIQWNAAEGAKLTADDLVRAQALRTAVHRRVSAFMEEHEFMLCPVSQVPPFPIDQEYVAEINGVPMGTYIDWMKSCYLITVTGLPAISVPCGFTDEGLPVGLQIVGRQQDELGVLQLAYAFQEATQFWRRRPALV